MAYGVSAEDAQGPASITLAKVVAVHIENWTVDLECVFTMQPLGPVPFSSPYCHRDHAGGVHVMPEIDSYCYVAQCADGTSFILGYILNPVTQVPTEFDKEEEKIDETVSDVDPSWRGFRDPLEPGDIFLGTVDGNKVVVRRGGVVQIGSTSLAQRIYIPVENVIRDYFQRYQAFSPVGEIEWGHAILANGEDPSSGTGSVASSDYFLDDGQKNALKTAKETPVLVRYNIKDLAQEDVSKGKYTIEVRAGRLTKETLDTEVDAEHVFANADLKKGKGKPQKTTSDLAEGITPEEKGVISITIYSHDDGPNKDKVTYAFQINRDGDNFLYTKGSIRHEIEKDFYATIHGSAKVEWGAGADSVGTSDPSSYSFVEFLNSNEFRMYCEGIIMQALGKVIMIQSKDLHLETSGDVNIGEGADNKVVRMEDLQTFMQSAFSCVTAWGPSGPMIPTFTPNVGSAKVKVKP